MGISESVIAAMIGAGATMITALFQIIPAFRSPESARRPQKSRFRSVLWTLALVFAAGVGGFAYAEYRSQHSRSETNSLRRELQTQMQVLRDSTTRLQQLQLAAIPSGSDVATSAMSSNAMVTLPACRGAQVGFATERSPCSEQDALQVMLCAPVPSGAQVTGIELFSRAEDVQAPWADARMLPGQDAGSGRFADTHQERADAEQGRLVCQTFSHWGNAGRTVRVLVRYAAGGTRTPG